MRILARLNLMSAGIILTMTAAVLVAGLLTIDGVLYRSQERVLRLEMSRAIQSILQQLKLSGVRSAAAQAGVEDRALREQDGLRSARLYIVEEPDRRIVYHPERPAGSPAGPAIGDELFGRREGAFEYEADGAGHYAVFATVQPLGWLFVLSIDKAEMLQGRAGFLRAIGGVTFLVLLINAIFVGLFGRRHGRRIAAALDCVKRIENGELSARIAAVAGGDEIGRLQAGINAMGAGLEQRALAQREAEAEREARRAAEAASRAKGEFLANMSHELRTPLNAVLGYAELLRREPGLPDRHAGWLATIAHSGQHLLTLINDLLDSAKMEAGKLELALSHVELTGLLRGVADIMRERMEDKGLRFATELPPGPLDVWADEKRLRQVLLNLLGNAAKFTDQGEVRLCAGVLRREAGTLRLRFEVKDTGLGMTNDQLEAIFRPFEQVGEASRRAVGTGLGLAISRQLAHLMGGELEVESSPGAGSRFWFEIDLAAVEDEPRPARSEEALACGSAGEDGAAAPAMVAPERSELEVLHGLALAGSMRDIRDHADRLAAADSRYAAFADRLRTLARAYRSQAILALVEEHLRKDRIT